MKPVFLRIEGFRIYGQPVELDLSLVGACTVTGGNSTGKSTLFDAMLWALYGDSSEHTVDTLVSFDSERAEVESVWEDITGVRHTFTRSRKRRGSTTATYESSDGQKAKGGNDVSARAEHLLGCDVEMFKLSSMARQGDLGRFAELSPSQRREEMREMLVGDIFEDASQKVAADKEDATKEQVVVSDSVSRLRAKGATYEDAADALARATVDRDEAGKALEALQAQQRLQGDPERLARAEAAERELVEVEATIEEAATDKVDAAERIALAEADVADAKSERDTAEAAKDAALSAWGADAEKSAKVARNRLGKLEQTPDTEDFVCWECGNVLSPEERAKQKRKIKKQLAKACKAKKARKEAVAAYDVAEQAERQKQRALTAAQQDEQDADKRLAASQAKIEGLQALAEEADKLREQAAAGGVTEEQVAEAERRHAMCQQEVGRCEVKFEEAQEAVDALAEAEDKEKAVDLRVEALEEMTDALRSTGLPHMLLDRRVQGVEDAVNHVLSRLRTADDMRMLRMRFRMEHPNTGNPTMGVDVLVGEDSEWLDYSQTSGGIRARVDVAVRVAMASLAGVTCRTLIIDEGTAMLDPTGVESLLEIVEQLISEELVESVYLITHDERLNYQCETNIKVDIDDSGASHAVLSYLAA